MKESTKVILAILVVISVYGVAEVAIQDIDDSSQNEIIDDTEPTLEEVEEECVPDWECDEWTICSLSGEKSQECRDTKCTPNSKTFEEKSCDPLEAFSECPEIDDLNIEEVEQSFFSVSDYKVVIDMNTSYNGWIFTDHPIWDSENIPCYLGDRTGENINWLYCRSISINLKVISTEGIILTDEYESATLVYDENHEYVETTC